MKRLVKIICVIFLLTGLCSCYGIGTEHKKHNKISSENNELRAVWINYNELSMEKEKVNDVDTFTKKIKDMFENVSDFGLDTVVVQVRPFSDALYDSAIFPWSKYISGEQGRNPGYDPLKLMVDIAHENNLKIHAWINPYRVSYNTDYSKLSENNPARKWHDDDDKNNDRYLFTTKSGIYYNPASLEVQKMIIDGVREIVNNYDVDGIHMDDYFYPEMYEDFDLDEYNKYISIGGIEKIDSWRRENVNALVSGIYSAIKSIDKDILFGISPGGNIEVNLNKNFADVKTWTSEKGYVDYIMPQLYYGFENRLKPFESTYDEWESIVTDKDVSLYIGLPMYKTGKEDKNAGDAGKSEFMNNSDIIKRQLEYIREKEKYSGFAIYSYSSLFDNNLLENSKKEIKNLKSML